MQERLLASGIEFDMIFGPAYKGIPLGAAVAVELARLGPQRALCLQPQGSQGPRRGRHAGRRAAQGPGADRRRRDVGRHRGARVDRHHPAAGATPHAVAIALDRQEKATENGVDVDHSAVQYVRDQLGLQVCAIATLADLLQYLSAHADDELGAHHEQRAGLPGALRRRLKSKDRMCANLTCGVAIRGAAAGWLRRGAASAARSGIYTCTDAKGRTLHGRPADCRLHRPRADASSTPAARCAARSGPR